MSHAHVGQVDSWGNGTGLLFRLLAFLSETSLAVVNGGRSDVAECGALLTLAFLAGGQQKPWCITPRQTTSTMRSRSTASWSWSTFRKQTVFFSCRSVLIAVWGKRAEWCGPCKFIAPVSGFRRGKVFLTLVVGTQTFEEFSKEFQDVVFIHVDVDVLEDLPDGSDVRGVVSQCRAR